MAKACGQVHHAVARVAIQDEVGRQRDQASAAPELARLEARRPQLGAQGLGVVTSGNGVAVVAVNVGELG